MPQNGSALEGKKIVWVADWRVPSEIAKINPAKFTLYTVYIKHIAKYSLHHFPGGSKKKFTKSNLKESLEMTYL